MSSRMVSGKGANALHELGCTTNVELSQPVLLSQSDDQLIPQTAIRVGAAAQLEPPALTSKSQV